LTASTERRTSGGESGAALWCGYFGISFNATWVDTRNVSDTTPYCGQKWERRCVCVDFEKLVLIYIILFTVLATGFAAALLENAKLTRENERLKKILYRRGYK
jgi:hypothetical protein